MRLPDSSPPRLLVLGLSAAACATVAAIGATSACLTDPPPDLPLVEQPPAIDHNAIIPADGTITGLPPDGFTLVISVPDPTQACQWSVYDSDSNQQYIPCTACGAESSKDGKVPVNFTVSGAVFDPTICHHIVFVVGGTFADPQCRYGGSDVAHWDYQPPNASCVSYDASALGDGAFPEAGSDALPVRGGDL